MWQQRTLAQVRDAIRREIGITPPSDTKSSLNVGDPPTSRPHPSNQLLNQMVAKAISYINTSLDLPPGHEVVSIAVAGQTQKGPYRLSLDTDMHPYLPGQISNIRHVSWHNGKVSSLLEPTSMVEMDALGRNWLDDPPSTPRWFAIEGRQLWLIPAPQADGTIKMVAGASLLHPVTDSDTFGLLPSDLIPAVIDIAISFLGLSSADDDLMMERVRRAERDRMDALERITHWYNSQNKRLRHKLYYGR